MKARQELGAGQDGRGRDRGVLLGARLLDKVDVPALLEKGVADEFLVAELVRDRLPRGYPFQDVLDGPGVPPGEQAVEVAELVVELVVFLRADGHDRVKGIGFFEGFGEVPRPSVGNPLGVLDAELPENPLLAFGHEEGGDDEGAEKIPLARFVRPDVPGLRSEELLFRHEVLRQSVLWMIFPSKTVIRT